MKRILSLMLCFVMVMSTLIVVPATAAGQHNLIVSADKTEAAPGDTINFTISLDSASMMGSLQMVLDIPTGLTYVAGSGKLADGIKTTLGYDSLDWTEISLMVNGFGSAADYESDSETVLATFQCTVDDGFSGTAEVGLTSLEFCSCQDFEDYTHLYNLVPATINVGGAGGSDSTEVELNKYDLAVVADKTEVVAGDTVNFTIMFGPVDTLGSLQMILDIPAGLTYVANSGKLADGLKEKLGYDSLDWTEVSLMVNGFGSAADYESATNTTIATFQCTVDDTFSGSAEVGLTNLEFCSCQDFEDYTHLFTLKPATLQGPQPSTYTLTFVTDGSEVAPVEDIEPGTVIDLAGYTTAKDGYQFLGWYADAAYETPVTSVTVDADTSVYAKFVKEYKLTYYVDDAVNEEVIGTEGQVITLKAVPAKSGYDVLGWFIDNAGEAVEEITLNSDVNVYAQYEYIPVQYTLTFTVDGEEYGTFKLGENRTIALADIVDEVPNPTKAGYRFDGWSIDGAIVDEVYGDGDKTLVAEFVKQYTLTFTAEGIETTTEVFDVDTPVDLTNYTVDKDNYIFTGWTLDGAPVTSVTMDADKEVVAAFVEAAAIVGGVKYETFETALANITDGSEMTLLKDVNVDSIIAINNDLVLDLNTHTITGTANKTIEVYADLTIKNGSVINTKAAGRAVDTRKAVALTIESAEIKTTGSGNTQALTVGGAENDTIVEIKDSTVKTGVSGYAIIAFVESDIIVKNSDLSGYAALYYKAGSANSTATVDADSSLFANGHAGETFGAVVFEDNDIQVTIDAPITMEDVEGADSAAVLFKNNSESTIALNGDVNGQVIAVPEAGYSKGAVVTTTNAEVAEAIEAEGFLVNDPVDGVYGVAGVARTITFVTSDGIAVDPITTVDGSVINFTGYNLEREGYTFAGWYAEETRETPVISLTLTEDVTLYAKFTTTLKFDTKGGDPIADVIWIKDAVADLSHYTPTRTNYDFAGWYADTYYTTPADAMLTMDVHKTVYAKWDAQAGLGETSVPYMIEAIAQVNPDNGEKVFNAGETIYVDYIISSTEIDTLGSFQFNIDYDDTLLDFVAIEGALTSADGVLYTDLSRGRVSFDVDGGKAALDITGGKKVVTAVFTAKSDVEGDAIVGFDENKLYEVTPMGYDKNRADINLVEDTVTIKNIIVTFQSGDNAAFVPTDDDIATKVNYNVAGFIEVGFDVPADKLEAADDFRLCADTTTEPLWLYEETGDLYTSYEVTQIQFTENATFIAQVVATGDITVVAGENGTVEGKTTFTVDAGTVLTDEVLLGYVTPVANPGYVFDKFDPTDAVVAGDLTITVLFQDAEYTIINNINPSIAGVDITAGIVTDPDVIRHGTDVVFTVTPVDEDANHIVEVGYTVDGVQVALTPDADGNYTIPGDAITGDVGIYALTEDTHLVTFVAGDNGSVAADAVYYVNDGEALTTDDIDDAKTKITPDPGYKFIGFAIDGLMVTEAELTTNAIYAALTVEVIFDDETYTLTREDGTTTVEVTHGDDYTFVPELPGKIITNITGEYSDGTPVDVTKNDDGSYTIDGDDIIDDITLNAEYVDGTIRFILNRQYRAIRGNTTLDIERKIAVLEVAQLPAGKKYAINDGDFHWSERYNAYVHVVPGLTEYDETTAAMIVSQLVELDDAAGEAYDVEYLGDMNQDGYITVNDAMIITDMLHQKRLVPTSEKQVLMADVVGSVVAGEERVTTADVDEVRMDAEAAND